MNNNVAIKIELVVICSTLFLIVLNFIRIYFQDKNKYVKLFLDFIPTIIPLSCALLNYRNLSILYKWIESLNIMLACVMLVYYFYNRKIGKYLLSPIVVSIGIILKFIW